MLSWGRSNTHAGPRHAVVFLFPVIFCRILKREPGETKSFQKISYESNKQKASTRSRCWAMQLWISHLPSWYLHPLEFSAWCPPRTASTWAQSPQWVRHFSQAPLPGRAYHFLDPRQEQHFWTNGKISPFTQVDMHQTSDLSKPSAKSSRAAPIRRKWDVQVWTTWECSFSVKICYLLFMVLSHGYRTHN